MFKGPPQVALCIRQPRFPTVRTDPDQDQDGEALLQPVCRLESDITLSYTPINQLLTNVRDYNAWITKVFHKVLQTDLINRAPHQCPDFPKVKEAVQLLQRALGHLSG